MKINKKIFNLTILGIFWGIFLGSFFHFTYKLSGNCSLVGLFSVVNESTWEHLKLAVFPLFFFSLIEYFSLGRSKKGFWSIKAVEIYLACFLIVTIFYGYKAILGRNYLFLDIGLFVFSVIMAKIVSYRLLIKKKFSGDDRLAIILIFVLIFALFFFTFSPPQLFLFKDPRKQP